MKREDRTKQFLPFDAMKGLEAALRREEDRLARVERRELGEEDAAVLSAALSHLKRGDTVQATFYADGRYVTLRGIVNKVDEIKRVFILNDTVIPFDELYALTDMPSED